MPILGDDFYPELWDRPLDDFRRPLQLLASTLEFTDPVTGAGRAASDTRRDLQAWTSLADWEGDVSRVGHVAQHAPDRPSGTSSSVGCLGYAERWKL